MNPADEPPPLPTSDPVPHRRRSAFGWFLLAVAAVSAGLCGYQLWMRATAHTPPEINLDDADPDVAEVIRAARAAVRQYPRFADAWGHLGMTLQAHGYHAQAATCYLRASEYDERNPQWPYLRATCAIHSGSEEAVPDLERAVRRASRDPFPRLLLGETLLEQGRIDDAERQFAAVVAADPRAARAHLGLGRVALARGDQLTAAEHLGRALSFEKGMREPYDLLATAYHGLGDAARAEEVRRDAGLLVRSGARWPDPYLEQVAERETGLQADSRRANALFGAGRPNEALALLDRLVRTRPASAPARSGLGRMLVLCKRPAEAIPHLEESLRLDPKQSIPHFYLGAAFDLQEKHREAVTAYRRAIELQPNFADAHYELARALHRLGDRDGAASAARECLRYNPNSVLAAKALGVFLAEQGKYEEAVASLTLAAKLAPEDEEIQRLLQTVRLK